MVSILIHSTHTVLRMALTQKHQTVSQEEQQAYVFQQSNLHHLLNTKPSSLIHFVESHCVWTSFEWVACYYFAHFNFSLLLCSHLIHARTKLSQALFGACRIPELSNKDTVAVNPDSSHVVVLENNQLYFFQALWPDGTVAVNEEDILEILLAIKTDASKLAPEISSRNALGVLTTLPRREWAVARDAIISASRDNGTALEIVDGALFVLVIDDIIPKDIHEAAANMLHGTYNLKSENNLIDYQVREWMLVTGQ